MRKNSRLFGISFILVLTVLLAMGVSASTLAPGDSDSNETITAAVEEVIEATVPLGNIEVTDATVPLGNVQMDDTPDSAAGAAWRSGLLMPNSVLMAGNVGGPEGVPDAQVPLGDAASAGATGGGDSRVNPATGDNIVLLVILAGVSVAALGTGVAISRKRSR